LRVGFSEESDAFLPYEEKKHGCACQRNYAKYFLGPERDVLDEQVDVHVLHVLHADPRTKENGVDKRNADDFLNSREGNHEDIT